MRRALLMLLGATVSAGAVPVVPAIAAEATNPAADPVGDWIGTLDADQPIRVAVHFKRENGALTGTADSPDQGASGIVMSEVILDGDNLNFTIDSIDGRFVGTWNAAKQHYVGTWSQGGRMLALEFGRGTYPPPATAPVAGH